MLCDTCSRPFTYRRGWGCSSTRCGACFKRLKRKAKKLRIVELFDGSCAECGYAGCLAALELHHPSPDKKEFEISGGLDKRWEAIEKELDELQLLCANCHREVHYSD